MSFPDDPRDLSVSFAFGDTWRASSPSFDQVSPGATADDPGPVLGEAVITRGRVGDAAETTPTKVDGLSVRNEDGEYSPDNPYGANYGQLVSGVPVQLAVDVGAGSVPLATIFADDFVPSWAGPGVDAKVAISGMGVLERIARLRDSGSPMRRTGIANRPIAYWPMEDQPGSTFAAAAVAGGSNAIVLGGTVDFGAFTDLAGSITSPDLTNGGFLAFAAVGGSATSWHVEFAMKVGYVGAATARVYALGGSDTHAVWRVFTPNFAGDTVDVFIGDQAGGITTTLIAAEPANFSGEWHHYALTAEQSGGNIVSRLWVDGALAATSTTAGTLAPVNQVYANQNQVAVTSVAHVLIGDGPTPSGLAAAMNGYDGETAANRIERICAEIGVTASVVSASGETSDDDVPLGPQPTGTAISILRDAEDGGEGVLDETTGGKPRYTTNAALLNLTPIELDFEAHVADLFPLGTERDWRGQVAVTGSSGGEAIVTNPADTSAPAAELQRNVPPSAVANHAGWLGLIAFLRKPRYVVVLDLRANSAALALMPTDLDLTNRRLQISAPPVEMVGPGPLDLLVVGTRQRVGADGWVVDCHCEPYGPYRVRQLANTPPDSDLLDGWLIPDSCTLASSVNATATSWSVNISPLMTTSASDFPCRVLIGGEEVWITACSGAASPQTWAVTRSVNGVTKAHSAGAEIEFLDPIILTL